MLDGMGLRKRDVWKGMPTQSLRQRKADSCRENLDQHTKKPQGFTDSQKDSLT